HRRSRLEDGALDRDAPAAARVPEHVRVAPEREPGIAVAEVLGDLVRGPAAVDQQRRRGVAEVVDPDEARRALAVACGRGALVDLPLAGAGFGGPRRGEGRDPDAAAPVLAVLERALRAGEDRRRELRPAGREEESRELACDRGEELGVAAAAVLR